MNRLNTCIILFTLLVSLKVDAQINQGGVPWSFQVKYFQQLISENLSTTIAPEFNHAKAKTEDAAMIGSVRFAAPIPVQYNLDNSGIWTTLENGDRIWRLKIKSKDALGIFFRYNEFYLAADVALFMYNESGSQIFGAYTAENNKPSLQFMTGMIDGEIAIVELYEPANVKGKSKLQISQIMHAYHVDHIYSDSDFNAYAGFDFGESLPCHIDSNCPEGDGMNLQKRSIARIARVFEEGVGWCTGALINNANFDGTPYILSAFHCQAGYTPIYDLWRFDFEYEKPFCNDNNEPTYNSILGCNYVSGREESDFVLFELSEPIPSNYNVYYNGWDRSDDLLPQHSLVLHHPKGDVKKVSVDDESSVIIGAEIHWSNGVTTPPDYHFRSILDAGTIEPGSSGAPYLNEQGVIVGQLHGGNANCDEFVTYFGRLSKSWDQGNTPDSRLQDWLDPENEVESFLQGYDPNFPQLGYSKINGVALTPNGDPINSVNMMLSGNVDDNLMTGINGKFEFENLPLNSDYELNANKNNDPLNGVTTYDLVLIQQHILGIENLNSPEKILAADVNQSGSITTLDLVAIRRVILEIDETFPAGKSWLFTPSDVQINNLTNPGFNQTFIGIKLGDVNENVDPTN